VDLLTLLNTLVGLIGGVIAIGSVVVQAIKRLRQRQQQAKTFRPTMPLPRFQAIESRTPFLSHPVLLTLGIATTITMYTIQVAHVPNNPQLASLYGLCFLTQFVYWVYIMQHTIRLRRWGWLIGMILVLGWSGIIYGLWGPTQPRYAKQAQQFTR